MEVVRLSDVIELLSSLMVCDEDDVEEIVSELDIIQLEGEFM